MGLIGGQSKGDSVGMKYLVSIIIEDTVEYELEKGSITGAVNEAIEDVRGNAQGDAKIKSITIRPIRDQSN